MRYLKHVVAALAFAASVPLAQAQDSALLEQLRGGAGAGALRSGGVGGELGGGPGFGSGASGEVTSIIGGPSGPAQPAGANEAARRRVQEIELRRLHRQLDKLEDGEQPRNGFQSFMLQSTGRDLPLFGMNLFKNTPSTFAPLDEVPVTPDYLIGPGDEIVMTGWGQINVNVRQIVDRNGQVNIPRVGMVQVAGLKYQDLASHIKAAFARIYRNFELSVTLGRLRSIQVFVVGQARRPGTYTVSSLSTLVNAIFAAGGPSQGGSMRSIILKRDNRVVVDFDLYDLLVTADKSRDAPLMPGDIIQFRAIGPLVAVNGAVNAPAVYELRQSTPLFDVLRWAGGLATTASGRRVLIERIEDRKVRRVEEIALDVSGLAKPLHDGDLVSVESIAPRFDNVVTLRGNVAYPGRFPWRDGMRIRDLIPEKEALLSREYLARRNQVVGLEPNVAHILREQSATGTRLTIEDLHQERRAPDEIAEQTLGETIRRIQTEAEAARFLNLGRLPSPPSAVTSAGGGVVIVGAGQGDKPDAGGEVARLEAKREVARVEAAKADAVRLVSQIRPPANEVNWDYAVVERISTGDLSTSLVPFNLAKALEGDAQHNLMLQKGDIVTIFSKDDLQVPVSRKAKYVRLEGELNQAGVFELRPGETLRQLVLRAGGFTSNAYLFGAVFTRESSRNEQQRSIDEALNRLERDVLRFNIQRAQNVLSGEDNATLGEQARATQNLVDRLRLVRATGRIVLELPEEASVKDLPDVALEDGDRLVVPPRPSMVSVFGSVFTESSFIYKPEKQLSDYLNQAGGPTKSADRSSAYVLRADGSVLSRRHLGFLASFDRMKLMPGDSIVVPEELDKTTVLRNLKDVAQLFYHFGLGAAAIKVLRD